MKLRWLGAWAVIGTLNITGCASAEDFSKTYQEYNSTFERQQGHTIHVVPRDGYKLHAREYLPVGSPPDSASFVLMHGFPDSLHLYDQLAPLLATKSRVITFDFLGWGNSEKPVDHVYNVASLRRDLEAVIEHFALKEVRLVVHDASGPPGIDYVLDNQAKTAELIVLNTIYGPSNKHVIPPSIDRFSTPGLRRYLLVRGATISDSRWQDALSTQVGAFFADPLVREKYLPIFVHQALRIRPAFFGLTKVWKAEIQGRAGRLEQLRELGVPTKTIFGASDPYLNPDLARELNQIIPKSKLYLVASAGHYVQLDRPAEVARLILGE